MPPPVMAAPPAVARDPASAATERAMLLCAAVVALVFLHSPGTGDMRDFWVPFLENMCKYGLVEGFHANSADYPPFSHAILLLVGRACTATGTTPFIGIKVCLLLFFGVSVGIFRAFWKGLTPLTVFVGTGLLSSVMLGYLDIVYTPTLLLSLWALSRRRIALFSALYAVTCLIKWQPVIFAPFVFWYALRPAAEDEGTAVPLAGRIARLAVPGGLVTLGVAFVFGWPLLAAFRSALVNPYLSGTALNLNWAWTYLLCRWNPEKFGPLTGGFTNLVLMKPLHGWVWLPKALFAGVYALTLWRFDRGVNSFPNLLRAALLGYLAYCLFNTGVHENHFYVAAVLACVLAGVEAGESARAVTMAVMAGLNLVIFYGFAGSGMGFDYVVGIDLTFPLSLLYVAIFLWWWTGWLRAGEWVRRPAAALAPGTPLDLVPKSA